MSEQRVSRAVAFLDLDHGILVKGPSALLSVHGSDGRRGIAGWLDRIASVVALPVIGEPIMRTLGRAMDDDPEKLKEIGKQAASELELAPHALSIIDEHRKAGRRVVGLTHVPEDAAQAFADELGLDAVVATKPDGPTVWGRGKLQAAREWAKENGASLRRSYFYGGAFSDAALLAEVGRPNVVDPDPRLAALAWLKGWPTRSLFAPAGVFTVAHRELQDIARPFGRPEFVPYANFEFHDLHHIPDVGPAIVVGNHRSYFDSLAVGLAISRTGRAGRFLGKKEVFDVPIFGTVARWAGGIRVERGTGSDEPLQAAAAALEAGELIFLMPEGTIPRGPAFFEPELKGRWGAARLAAMTKAPVIPLGLWGTEKVWPRSSRLPNINPLKSPLVTVRAGEPVQLTYGDPDVDTKAIMMAIVDLLPDEAKVKQEPTEEELRRTFPPGYKGDPNKEAERRPGTDT
jgi:putative phosphoserine phosphatase / 1-acylglycerol-3-phosphate O-acyltransferase